MHAHTPLSVSESGGQTGILVTVTDWSSGNKLVQETAEAGSHSSRNLSVRNEMERENETGSPRN